MRVPDPSRIRITPRATHKTKIYVLLFVMLALGPIGNVVLDKGMKQIGSLDLASSAGIWGGFRHVVSSPTIWVGMTFLAGYLICYMLVLSLADYSFVLPFLGMTYALVPLLAYLFLHEKVSAARWIGIVLLFLGVLLINRTPPRTTEPGATS